MQKNDVIALSSCEAGLSQRQVWRLGAEALFPITQELLSGGTMSNNNLPPGTKLLIEARADVVNAKTNLIL